MAVIANTFATGTEMAECLMLIRQAIQGQPRGIAIISSIAYAILLEQPTITPTELSKATYEVSKYICMVLAGIDGDEVA